MRKSIVKSCKDKKDRRNFHKYFEVPREEKALLWRVGMA
jgi:hypothetical protein